MIGHFARIAILPLIALLCAVTAHKSVSRKSETKGLGRSFDSVAAV